MRKLLAAAVIGVVTGVAGATNTDEPAPESRAYFAVAFGGERAAVRDLHYGLRIDHDTRFVDGEVPALMQLDFTRRGLADARVNGLSFLKASYRLRQAEEAAEEEAAADEPGFFESLFADDEEEDGEESADEGETAEAEPAEGAAEGTFMGFNAVDWGLLALGLAGVGYAGSEVAKSEEPATPKADDDGDGIPNENERPPCQIDTPPFPPGCDPNALNGRMDGGRAGDTLDRAHQAWLDAGTGRMGDLVEVRD